MLPNPRSSHRKQKSGKPADPAGSLGHYARWSGLAFQMVVVVLAGYFGGDKLDQLLHRTEPLYALIGVVAGVIAAMALAIRMILKKTGNN